MNQLAMEPGALLKPELEGLLRIALFSKDWALLEIDTSLNERPRQLTRNYEKL